VSLYDVIFAPNNAIPRYPIEEDRNTCMFVSFVLLSVHVKSTLAYDDVTGTTAEPVRLVGAFGTGI